MMYQIPNSSLPHLALVAAGATLAAAPVTGAECDELIEVQAPAADDNDRFGAAMAADGDIAAIGARTAGDLGMNAGALIAIEQLDGNWSATRLTAANGGPGDQLGCSVDVFGDTIVVGAWLADPSGPSSGSAHVFRLVDGSWIEEAQLEAPDGQAGDLFGASVAIFGDVAVIGARGDDDIAYDAGAVYVFNREGSTWSLAQKLTVWDSAFAPWFGQAIAIDGDSLLVGALDDENGAQSGAVYAFAFDGNEWVPDAKLLAPDGDSLDLFGSAIAISGSIALVGAHEDEAVGSKAGSAYVFQRGSDGWSFGTKLVASDSSATDHFGASVALDGTTALIGAWGCDDAAFEAGAAYVFKLSDDTWTETSKLFAEDGAAADKLGSSVSMHGGVALLGAPEGDGAGEAAGSIYVATDVADEPWVDCNENGVSDACDLATGTSADVDGDGIPDECQVSCAADLDGDEIVGVTDLTAVILAWDTPDADATGDGMTDVQDLVAVIAAWGSCG